MVDTGYKKATNKIVVAGTPFVTEKEIETANFSEVSKLDKANLLEIGEEL